MMNRILGFLPAAPEPGVGESCAWTGATALKTAAVAISNGKPLWIKVRFIFVPLLLFVLFVVRDVELSGDA
jgi:hypothetical protein